MSDVGQRDQPRGIEKVVVFEIGGDVELCAAAFDLVEQRCSGTGTDDCRFDEIGKV